MCLCVWDHGRVFGCVCGYVRVRVCGGVQQGRLWVSVGVGGKCSCGSVKCCEFCIFCGRAHTHVRGKMACVRLQYDAALYIYRSDSSRSEDTRTRPLPLTLGAWRRRGVGRGGPGGREGHRGGATRACPLPTASQPRHLQRGTPVRCCLHLTSPPQPTPGYFSQPQPLSSLPPPFQTIPSPL